MVDGILLPWLARTEAALSEWVLCPPATIEVRHKRFGYDVGSPTVYAMPSGWAPPTEPAGSWNPGTYAGQYASRRSEMSRTIRDLRADVGGLEARYEAWKPHVN